MRGRGNFTSGFFIFFLSSLLLFSLANNGLLKLPTGFLEQMTVALQRTVFVTVSASSQKEQTAEQKLVEENKQLLLQLAKQKELEKENQALRDQFQTSKISSRKLLPAQVVGRPSFIPGESSVTEFVIDKGEADGLKEGAIVVYKDSLIGRIVQLSSHLAVVRLVTDAQMLLTAKTMKTSALGVLKGQGGETMLLENVVLSDKLEQNDLVQTKGDVDKTGDGFPPDLVIGKIISVKKVSSALFQVAEVRSLVNFSHLDMVFVFK